MPDDTPDTPGNSGKTAARTMPEGRRFQPGVSGNPSGRPKIDPDLKLRCRDMTPAALKRLEGIIGTEEEPSKAEPKDVLAAIKLVLAYGYGQPTQPIGGDPDNPLAVAGMSTPEILAALPDALKRLGVSAAALAVALERGEGE